MGEDVNIHKSEKLTGVDPGGAHAAEQVFG